ncbi:MAG: hypothetical protein PHU44_00125 [Syntrophales bacterium]|nr:hypothetical protein [Syntrophales bacterium]MDD5640107.1 hypothetical protein [Syntrophales bacterium]
MADTIKTQVLKTLEAMLQSVPELGSVHRRPPLNVDLDKVKTPALFFWDEEERKPRNRLMLGVMRLTLAVFIRLTPGSDHGFTAFSDLADTIAGRIHGILAHPAALAGKAVNIQELTTRKALANELFGELVLIYQVTYAHSSGNAFSTSY